ncbi:hypothetical protein FTRO_0020260 [Fructobacillus tropaeoli]|uniref:Peptidase C39-like domain-containing protein n=2 Tax=Fructobacillus tropaeoli TaxID=709323 RepID=A0A3F3HCR1_9LACO|nr:hypothetical protein FTRO_0020260 [Fructobacillus tropaeoli]
MMRIKMFKSGKNWVMMGVAIASALTLAGISASADVTSAQSNNQATATATVNSSGQSQQKAADQATSGSSNDTNQADTVNDKSDLAQGSNNTATTSEANFKTTTTNSTNTGSESAQKSADDSKQSTKTAESQSTVSTSDSQSTSSDQNQKNTTNNQSAATTNNGQKAADNQQSQRDTALTNLAQQHVNGYIYSPDVSGANGGWNWFVDGKPYTGFQYHEGTYYWFVDGVRQNQGWRNAWNLNYYTDQDGRAVQGIQNINGQDFDFGNDNTYYLRSTGYLYDGSAQNGGYRWYDNGQLYSGFRGYMGTYYWFLDGVRQNEGWRSAWGLTYYTDQDGRAVQGSRIIDSKLYDFGDDNTYYERPLNGYLWDGSAQNGGYRWYDNGNLYTGFKAYTGTYYWFVDGVRQNQGWRNAWGLTYYTDQDGRAVQGIQGIDNGTYFFGYDGTYYMRTNQYYTDGNSIYYAGGDGRALTGNQNVLGRSVSFDGNGRLDVSQLNIDFPHVSLNQGQLGAPEGCEGVSFQMALSAKGKNVPNIHDIYNQIGYGFNVSADQGFHGNPFGYGQWYTQTVLASALARNLNGVFGVQTKDITGAGVNDVLVQLLSWNPVITYVPWNLQLNNASNNFHVQLIYGYQNGGFKIADPLQIARGANYWLSTSDWQYLNSNVQPTGYGAPASMNVAII